MVRIWVRFWLFVLVWVAVLFLVFPRSGEWAFQRGRLSCSTAAVQPGDGGVRPGDAGE